MSIDEFYNLYFKEISNGIVDELTKITASSKVKETDVDYGMYPYRELYSVEWYHDDTNDEEEENKARKYHLMYTREHFLNSNPFYVRLNITKIEYYYELPNLSKSKIVCDINFEQIYAMYLRLASMEFEDYNKDNNRAIVCYIIQYIVTQCIFDNF